MSEEIIIIPARLGSTRLPNKPLADIAGKSMIVRVLEQAKKTKIDNIIVASADLEISQEVEKNGFKSISTNPDLPSGTDRIFKAYKKLKNSNKFEYIINLQGDLPTIDYKIINNLLKFHKNTDYDIVTAVAEIKDEEEKTNPNVVKVAIAWKQKQHGKALYFSRATIPYNSEKYYHHIGIYIYTKKALEKFVKLPQSSLEKTEKLEQLRALENNMKIGVLLVDTVPLGVDTKEDLVKANQFFREVNR
jgi:3-deoxy-manno-octulosonate cytidylyltransferase (CMP-KDO synthetase)